MGATRAGRRAKEEKRENGKKKHGLGGLKKKKPKKIHRPGSIGGQGAKM